MDQLLARLTDLGYEIFGVFLPGAVGTLFLLVWWWALGPLAPLVTQDAVPQLSAQVVVDGMHSLDNVLGVGFGIPLLIASYFIGHFLLWGSRLGGALRGAKFGMQLFRTMTFRIQRPDASFDLKLGPLFSKVVEAVENRTGLALGWREIYPIAKNTLSEHRKFSLLSTYQNKYTLHRSLSLACVVLTWLSFLSALVAGLAGCITQHDLPTGWLITSASLASVLAIGFSQSFRFYWLMWGNSVVTELFTYFCVGDPANESSEP